MGYRRTGPSVRAKGGRPFEGRLQVLYFRPARQEILPSAHLGLLLERFDRDSLVIPPCDCAWVPRALLVRA